MLNIFNTKHMVWEDGETSVNYYELFIDDVTDLPSDVYYFSTDDAKYKIMQGSMAYDISNGDMYMMDSSGSWIKQ
jgi:hypothetical protein